MTMLKQGNLSLIRTCVVATLTFSLLGGARVLAYDASEGKTITSEPETEYTMISATATYVAEPPVVTDSTTVAPETTISTEMVTTSAANAPTQLTTVATTAATTTVATAGVTTTRETTVITTAQEDEFTVQTFLGADGAETIDPEMIGENKTITVEELSAAPEEEGNSKVGPIIGIIVAVLIVGAGVYFANRKLEFIKKLGLKDSSKK